MSNSKAIFFANYTTSTLSAPHRTTETELCPTFKEAREMVQTRTGYVIRQCDGINTMKYKTDDFVPSAQEQLTIDALLSVNQQASV